MQENWAEFPGRVIEAFRDASDDSVLQQLLVIWDDEDWLLRIGTVREHRLGINTATGGSQ